MAKAKKKRGSRSRSRSPARRRHIGWGVKCGKRVLSRHRFRGPANRARKVRAKKSTKTCRVVRLRPHGKRR